MHVNIMYINWDSSVGIVHALYKCDVRQATWCVGYVKTSQSYYWMLLHYVLKFKIIPQWYYISNIVLEINNIQFKL